MSRFRERMARADARIDRAFAEEMPAIIFVAGERRAITVIFESPDAPVALKGGGEILDQAPAFSSMTEEIAGLKKYAEVRVNDEYFWVTHIGADEMGRTRVTLGKGRRGNQLPDPEHWSQ
ncbi:head-tail joining protein [Escherichia coli]|nr:head-tail joining protein [Escherichia coli]